MKSFMLRKEDISRNWYHIDADNRVIGRVASAIAKKLMGKDKKDYTFHIDNGDYVVATNAQNVAITGKKRDKKVYYRHSGKPGNLKSTIFKDMIAKHPTRALELAVKRMLPKNRIGRHMFSRLKVYAGDKHEHEAQKPMSLEI